MARQEIVFAQAQAEDAQALIDFLDLVAVETDYLVMDEGTFPYSLEQTQSILMGSEEAPDQLCLLAKLGKKIIGLINVKAYKPYRISHVGDVFMAVAKEYWSHGIGRILLEEAIIWAQEMDCLKRLELTVQVRNVRAIKLYKSCGFEVEGTQKRGARTDEGEWLDLYYMGRLID